jgi:hypothetical protein
MQEADPDDRLASGTSVPNPFQICPAGVAFVADLTDEFFKRDSQLVRTRLKNSRIATATPYPRA